MSQESFNPQSRRKCSKCGLVNATSDEVCRRCGAPVWDDGPFERATEDSPKPTRVPKRTLLRRVVWILATTAMVLIIWYVSPLVSPNGLQPDQRAKVEAGIAFLQQHGFDREVFV